MEIEKKYRITNLLIDLNQYPYDHISQGYVSTSPVIRIRKKNDTFFLTCKSKGLMAREEFELEISEEEFHNLKEKVDFQMIVKDRYYIPLEDNLKIELDIFKEPLNGLIIAEVEFPSLEVAHQFMAPSWFGEELTQDSKFQNSHLCQLKNIDTLL